MEEDFHHLIDADAGADEGKEDYAADVDDDAQGGDDGGAGDDADEGAGDVSSPLLASRSADALRRALRAQAQLAQSSGIGANGS